MEINPYIDLWSMELCITKLDFVKLLTRCDNRLKILHRNKSGLSSSVRSKEMSNNQNPRQIIQKEKSKGICLTIKIHVR